VRDQEITDELWYDGALARGVNQHAVDHLSHLWQALRTTSRKFQATDTIEKWGGRKPKTFEEFVLEREAEFSARRPDSPREMETAMNRRDVLKASLSLLATRLAQPAGASNALGNTAEKEGPLSEPVQRIVETNGIRLNIAEQGKGPLVLLCHGFPESWYSWRHQLGALAAAGFHAVAPDMRGYGKSDWPKAIDQYTLFHLVGDMVGVLDALETKTAVIVGHDLGARVAWQAAQMRPDRFRGVVGSACRSIRAARCVRPAPCRAPRLRNSTSSTSRIRVPRTPSWAAIRGRRYATCCSARQARGLQPARPRQAGWQCGPRMVPKGGGFLQGPGAPATLPAWLTEADVDFYAAEFKRTGFTGALNWYRNFDRNWELQGSLQGAPVTVPALYIAGDRDFVVSFPGMDQLLANLKRFVPDCVTSRCSRCGHWTQQERPNEVNAAIIDFLRSVPS
jgi:pimeloyl-ACP methyl ester carboxylesterase